MRLNTHTCSSPWIRHFTANQTFSKASLDAEMVAAEHRQAMRLAVSCGDALDATRNSAVQLVRDMDSSVKLDSVNN